MKIRKKITLWISGTALLSTIVFSSIIFWRLMEEPFKLIDQEIQHMAAALALQMTAVKTVSGPYDLSGMPYNPDTYWIMVKNNKGKILYQSQLANYIELPVIEDKPAYLIERKILRSQIWLNQDDHDDVLFRVMVIDEQINGLGVEIRIAKPIEGLEEELIELAVDIGISLFICVLFILLCSYILAGRILSPVSAIIRKSKEISEESLDGRIPLRGSRDELYDLSVSLNKMFDRLQNSFNLQKEFIGNASHELKSPITLLMLAQEEMLMNEKLPPAQSKSLIKQLETTRRMSHLVKNLLDLSRLEQQGILNQGTIDLTVLLARVLDDYADVLTAKQISVFNHLAGPHPIHGDQEKLFRLFVNLIDNAIRYNLDSGGQILIKAEKSKTKILLEISNTGQQIPENDLPQIFEQFYRVEKSRSISHGGSGLGLAIAKKIVGLHHGEISIANDPDDVVKISVLFPV